MGSPDGAGATSVVSFWLPTDSLSKQADGGVGPDIFELADTVYKKPVSQDASVQMNAV